MDKSLIVEILERMLSDINKIKSKCVEIKAPEDLRDSDVLDVICMRLISIGESVKSIDKLTNRQLLSKFNEISWRDLKGMRDFIAHQYFRVDADIIYDICKQHLEALERVVYKVLDYIKHPYH